MVVLREKRGLALIAGGRTDSRDPKQIRAQRRQAKMAAMIRRAVVRPVPGGAA
jgi:hypothetical protein